MKPLALFDLDYTLLEGDSEFMWSRFMSDQKLVGPDFMKRISAYYQDYDEGRLDIHEYQAFLLRPLTLFSPADRVRLRSEYLETVRAVIRPGMMREVQRHRDEGYVTLLISASNSFVVEPIAGMLGFTDLICTKIKRDGENYTTELDGVPAFREGKVRRLQDWLAGKMMTLSESWGYSDSFNDLPLLEMVANPVAVTPDPRLDQHARQEGWKILRL
jgi:HAD superfamily hydrolase (TIGR01490 family)